jgi:hypothetical protein
VPVPSGWLDWTTGALELDGFKFETVVGWFKLGAGGCWGWGVWTEADLTETFGRDLLSSCFKSPIVDLSFLF